MRRFVIGLLATIGTLTLLSIAGVVGALWWFLPGEAALPARMVLVLDLRSGFEEVSAEAPLAALGLPQRPTQIEVIMALDRAAGDPRVKGLVARLGGGGPGLAQVQELRDAIARFRAAGKFAHAHADAFGEFGPGNRGYYLATAFDRISLQPMGAVGLTGVLIETPFVRDLLAKIGVAPSGAKRGDYKSAADMFTETTLSPANREALEAIADSLQGQITAGIGEGRNLAPPAVTRLIDRGPLLAEEALAAGLVDGLDFWPDALAAAKDEAGSGSGSVAIGDYAQATAETADDAPVVALVRGVGQIRRGESDFGPASGWVMGADTVAEALAAAIEDPDVAAILFRIDSGGGSVVASEAIGHQVRRAVEAGLPVVVSMGDVAASGGYWIAMDASKIVAAPGTLTGSIGVFAGKPVLAGLWRDLGVGWGQVARGANATMWSMLDDYTARGRARLDAFLDEVYAAFTTGVARGRGLTDDAVAAAAEGRVWTGAQAKELGLVDDLGGFRRALELAKEAAGIRSEQPVDLRPYPAPRSPWEELTALLARSPFGLALLQPWAALLRPPAALRAPTLVIR